MTMDHYYAAKELMLDMDRNSITDPNSHPASPEQIREAEQKLAINFPPSYRQFLSDFGSGGFEGWEVYGIGIDLMRSRIIWYTLQARRDIELDPGYVIVEHGGAGTYVVIDASKRNNLGEYPIVGLGVDGRPLEHISDSFGAWLFEELKWRTAEQS